jgi:hypothetical protein
VTKNVYALGLIILLSAICLASVASAQTSWWKTYGGSSHDQGYSVQQTTDGGYIVVGKSISYGAGSGDVYLIKTNAQGDTLWTRTYGGTSEDEGNSAQQTTDGGYIVAGYTYSFGPGTPTNDNVYLIKTNASGDTIWTRVYGKSTSTEGWSVRQTNDGGYIIVGYIDSPVPGTGDVYLIKTGAQGDTLWTRTYGGLDHDWGNSVQQTTDGGYIIAGSTASFGAGSHDVYLIKTNALGDTLWTRTYGGAMYDLGSSIQQTADNGYIIAGYTYSFGAGARDFYLIKTNASGDTLWTRTYGGSNYDDGYSVQQTVDSGYIVVGSTQSFGAGGADVYLVKSNAAGDTLWTRTYGGTNNDCGNSVRQTTDDGYIIAGYSRSFGAGGADVYLLKTDANGNVGIEEPPTRHPKSPTCFLVQPNPFISFARVPGHEAECFAISDVTGRQVAICSGDRVGEGLRPGVYFLSPVGPRAGKSATATIVKTAF